MAADLFAVLCDSSGACTTRQLVQSQHFVAIVVSGFILFSKDDRESERILQADPSTSFPFDRMLLPLSDVRSALDGVGIEGLSSRASGRWTRAGTANFARGAAAVPVASVSRLVRVTAQLFFPFVLLLSPAIQIRCSVWNQPPESTQPNTERVQRHKESAGLYSSD